MHRPVNLAIVLPALESTLGIPPQVVLVIPEA